MNALRILVFLLFASVCGFAQSNYYVSPAGNDANNGSLSTPWASLQYAVTQLSAGDTLNVMAGTYAGEVALSVSGTSSQAITIRNYQSDVAIVSGSTLPAYSYLMKIENVDYVTIDGLKFQDYQELDAIGILVINSSSVSILNNEFSNIDYSTSASGQVPNPSQNSQPIIVFGRDAATPVSDLLIKGNSIHDCEVGQSECISVNGNVDGFEVLNNQVYNNTNIGIVAIGHEGECPDPAFDQARNGLIKDNVVHDNPSPYAAAGGLYIDGGKDIVVENNISYNNDYGIEVGCENNGNAPNDPSASNIKVRNNQFYNNKICGIAIGGYNYPVSGKVESTTISNNSCYNNDTDNSYNGELLISYVENSSIDNNIFYTNNLDKVLIISSEANPTLSLDYNLYYSPSGSNDIVIEINGTEYNTFSAYQSGTSQDAHSLFADPQYVSAVIPNPDLHLQATSPAIDAGDPAFVAAAGETDMDGGNRVENGRVDIGADEYSSPMPVEYVSPFRAFPAAGYVELQWTTAIEIHAAKYIVQRSADLKTWEDVFSIAAEGHGASYTALDRAPIPGLAYYRLKQMDINGFYEFSDVVAVWWDASRLALSLFPNPVSERLSLSFDNPHLDRLSVQIFDAEGKPVWQRKSLRTQELTLDVSGWRAGAYIVQLVFENGVRDERVFVVGR